MKKLTEFINNKYVSLKDLDESVVEMLSNLEGYEITECCGCCDGSCDCGVGGYCPNCDCETTCEPEAALAPIAKPIEVCPEVKYKNIFASYPKVMDLYNVHGEFNYKCRFQSEYERANSEPIIFTDDGCLDCGKYFMCKGLHDDILTICSDCELSYPVLLFRNNGDIQLFAIKHMGTNGQECSIKNSLIDAADTLAKLEKRKEISWAQVLDVAIDNLDDLYTFLFTCTFEKEKYDKELEARAAKNEFPHPINKHA